MVIQTKGRLKLFPKIQFAPVIETIPTSNVTDYLDDIRSTLAVLPEEEICRIVSILDHARLEGKTVFIFGNGGSAATASHFACDLSKGAMCKGRPRFKVLSLTDNLPVFSAWANDSAYDQVFAEQLENFAEEGDIAIAISGSGNSPNVLNGVKTARIKGLVTIGLTGFEGGKLKDLVDIPMVVANHTMEQIEDVHMLLAHMITTCLRKISED
jgi:D-sedoheptulose 7-phosphate isomerase